MVNFSLTEGKCPHEWPGYCHQNFFSLEVVEVLMLIHPFHALYVVIFGTKQYGDKYNSLLLIEAGMSG